MEKLKKQKHKTLIIGLLAGLALVFGVVYVFDLSATSMTGVLVRIVSVVLVVMAGAFVTAGLLVGLKKFLNKRR